ncbi:MAG: [protein-PII] uridylyltransferase, partial [Pseudomonadota bacterium]
SLLDTRLIIGNAALFSQFRETFTDQVVRGTAVEFVDAKLSERDARHKASGSSRYLVEPNVKDGKGGLRDLHTLHWVLSYCDPAIAGDRFYDDMSIPQAADDAVLSEREQGSFRRAEDFLWRVRNHIHFLRGRADERLTFDLQLDVADRLGYTDRNGLRAVERFMKHYFIVAKEVGDLTRIVCAGLEMRQLKSLPALQNLFSPAAWVATVAVRDEPDFRVENGRLNVTALDVFRQRPLNFLRVFTLARDHSVLLHPMTLRSMRQSLELIDDALRADPEANAIFMDLLVNTSDVERILRRMNETGVLGRFVPEFGRIVALAQFNMYHHYTVDEHLIRTVTNVAEIARGEHSDAHPLSAKLFPKLKNKRVLFVAAFLHDVAKGRPEDHSIAGERIARELGPRFGLDAKETALVAWLIREHLTMSNVAQTRDIQDRTTIQDFAETVQTLERLRLLLLLTVVDIKAVGPGVFTAWKGQLLRELYAQTAELISGGTDEQSAAARAEQARAEFTERAAAAGIDSTPALEAHFPGYWAQTEPDLQLRHARLLETAQTSNA